MAGHIVLFCLIVLAVISAAMLIGTALDMTEKEMGLWPEQDKKTVKIDYCVHDLEISL